MAGASKVPENETKPARFRRVAGGRAVTAIKSIRLLARASGPSYEYTEADIAALEKNLTGEVGKAVASLRAALSPSAAKTPEAEVDPFAVVT